MNKRQATAYARRRWGKDARVEQDKLTKREREQMSERQLRLADLMRCKVGYRDSYMGAFHVMGFGPTWADAIRRADSRP